MKYSLLLMMVVLLAGACKTDEERMEVTVNLRNNPGNQQVSLVTMDYASFPLQLDTSLLESGTGQGHLTVTKTEPGIYYILFEKDGRYIMFINDQDKIDVDADWDDFSGYKISSPASAALKKLLQESDAYLKPEPAPAVLTDSIRQLLTSRQEEKSRQYISFLKQFADTTAQAPVAMYALGLLKQQEADSTVLKAAVERLGQRFQGNAAVQEFSSSYFAQLAKAAKTLRPGKKAPMFSLPDTTSQQVSLSDYLGKYTLVEFWASWCAICRKENPALVSTYNQFKDKNFAILGVSLDKDQSAWLQAIQKDNLAWQHVSDLKEWSSPMVELYNIEALPYNVLLDPEGTIVDINLSPAALQKRLTTLLSESALTQPL